MLFCFLCCDLLSVAAAQQQQPSSVNQPQPQSKINFETKILPILQRRCFECHAGENVEGDLRLDSKTGMLAGGHTGNAIVGASAADSELMRRINSQENGYRMPKSGAPLTPEEIENFRDWIDQGATWPGSNQPDNADLTIAEYWGEQLNELNQQLLLPRYRYAAYLFWPMMLLVIFWLLSVLSRSRRRNHVPDANASENQIRSRSWFRFSYLLFAVIALAVSAVGLYFFGMTEELAQQNEMLKAALKKSERSFTVSLEPGSLTLPPHPMHPPRMGGIYYRGNDERNPELFNGGFYRTATMEVALIDESGTKFNWNDRLTDQAMFISLTITRAPGTTPALFSPEVIESTFVKNFPQTIDNEQVDEKPESKVALQVIQPDQKWEARVPLKSLSSKSRGVTAGLVYLFYGKMLDGEQGRVHFAIQYRLNMKAGRIQPDSEIWMGSMYDLGGRVLIPRDGEVLLDHWFDFRPIPEIEGTNSENPTMLGIPEHVPQIDLTD